MADADRERVEEKGLGDFVAALASDRPTPGGGAAAAAALAMGRALLAMAAAVARRRAEGADAAWLAAVAEAEGRGAHASLALADRDAEAFAAIMAGLSLARGDEHERAARKGALAEAARAAAHEGEVAARACLEAVDQAAALEPRVGGSIRSDVRAGRRLALAALMITVDNLEANASLLPAGEAQALGVRTAELRATHARWQAAEAGNDERA